MKARLVLPLILVSGGLWLGAHYIINGNDNQTPSEVSRSVNVVGASNLHVQRVSTTTKKATVMNPSSEALPPSLTLAEIESAIAQIDSELVNLNAIERLNRNTASDDERIRYQELFKNRDKLNEQKLALKLADLNQKISDLEKSHASRLESYGIKHEEDLSN